MSAKRSSFLMCIKNDAYPTSLELRKVYRSLPDKTAAEHGYVRVIDESGEDYLYPDHYFVAIELSHKANRAFAPVSSH